MAENGVPRDTLEGTFIINVIVKGNKKNPSTKKRKIKLSTESRIIAGDATEDYCKLWYDNHAYNISNYENYVGMDKGKCTTSGKIESIYLLILLTDCNIELKEDFSPKSHTYQLEAWKLRIEAVLGPGNMWPEITLSSTTDTELSGTKDVAIFLSKSAVTIAKGEVKKNRDVMIFSHRRFPLTACQTCKNEKKILIMEFMDDTTRASVSFYFSTSRASLIYTTMMSRINNNVKVSSPSTHSERSSSNVSDRSHSNASPRVPNRQLLRQHGLAASHVDLDGRWGDISTIPHGMVPPDISPPPVPVSRVPTHNAGPVGSPNKGTIDPRDHVYMQPGFVCRPQLGRPDSMLVNYPEYYEVQHDQASRTSEEKHSQRSKTSSKSKQEDIYQDMTLSIDQCSTNGRASEFDNESVLSDNKTTHSDTHKANGHVSRTVSPYPLGSPRSVSTSSPKDSPRSNVSLPPCSLVTNGAPSHSMPIYPNQTPMMHPHSPQISSGYHSYMPQYMPPHHPMYPSCPSDHAPIHANSCPDHMSAHMMPPHVVYHQGIPHIPIQPGVPDPRAPHMIGYPGAVPYNQVQHSKESGPVVSNPSRSTGLSSNVSTNSDMVQHSPDMSPIGVEQRHMLAGQAQQMVAGHPGPLRFQGPFQAGTANVLSNIPNNDSSRSKLGDSHANPQTSTAYLPNQGSTANVKPAIISPKPGAAASPKLAHPGAAASPKLAQTEYKGKSDSLQRNMNNLNDSYISDKRISGRLLNVSYEENVTKSNNLYQNTDTVSSKKEQPKKDTPPPLPPRPKNSPTLPHTGQAGGGPPHSAPSGAHGGSPSSRIKAINLIEYNGISVPDVDKNTNHNNRNIDVDMLMITKRESYAGVLDCLIETSPVDGTGKRRKSRSVKINNTSSILRSTQVTCDDNIPQSGVIRDNCSVHSCPEGRDNVQVVNNSISCDIRDSSDVVHTGVITQEIDRRVVAKLQRLESSESTVSAPPEIDQLPSSSSSRSSLCDKPPPLLPRRRRAKSHSNLHKTGCSPCERPWASFRERMYINVNSLVQKLEPTYVEYTLVQSLHNEIPDLIPSSLGISVKVWHVLCLHLFKGDELAEKPMNWEGLAYQLGFSQSKVDIIRKFSENFPVRSMPAELVLWHWSHLYDTYGTKHCAPCTKQQLSAELKALGRYDLVSLIKSGRISAM